MKFKQTLASITIILLGALFINASIRNEPKKSYEYISIYYAPPSVTITKGVDKFESYKFKKPKARNTNDTREVFKLIEKYEKEGYTLIESNVYNTGGELASIRTYYLLRR